MRVIDLSSPDGNAFALMGIAREQARAEGRDASTILDEMFGSPSYAALLDVIDDQFPLTFRFINDPRDTGRGKE